MHLHLESCCVFQHTAWRSHRQAVLQCIEHFLERTLLPDSCQISRVAWERCIQHLPQPCECDGLSHKPLLFLMDDNFYYSSMRYEVYQLARKCEKNTASSAHLCFSQSINLKCFLVFFISDSLGFCQVYLQCELDLCISRNERRSEPVLTKVIQEMEMRLEPPNPEKNTWEKNSISLTSVDVFSKCDM